VLSDGPPGADVLLTPDFVGRSLQKAKEWTSSHQVSLTEREETDLSKPEGEVLLQSPTADSPIRAGDTLTVVINQTSGGTVEQGPRIYYELPQGASDRDVRILVVDETGEREVFRKAQAPGSKIDFHVQPKGRARARIFVNGVMIEEKELQ
jgi:serine/threonine-protein kinase